MKLKTIKDAIIAASEWTDLEILQYVNDSELEDLQDVEDLMDLINERAHEICEVEIISYAKAIEYLAEHDQSLNDSISIALEYGYELWSINSELLASLLATEHNKRDLEEVLEKLEMKAK